MRTEGRRLAANSVWSLLNQLARVGALALVLIALSRHFGPERFGALAFGLAFVRIFAVVAVFGMDRLLVRQLVESPDQSAALLRGAFRLKLLSGLCSYVLVLLVVLLLDPHDRLTISIVALAGLSLLFQAGDVFDYSFQAGNRFRFIFLGRTVPLLLATALKLIAVTLGAPLLFFAGAETLEAALIALSLFVVHGGVRAPNSSRSFDARGLLRKGFPLLVGSLAVMIYMRSDILILGKLAGYQAAGIYSAAAQITEACALFPMAFAPALFPILVRWRQRGTVFYRQQFEVLFAVAAWAGLAVAFGLTMVAPWLIRLLYGAPFAPAAGILALHAWATPFIFIGIMQSGYDVTEGLTWIAAGRTIGGAVLNVGLNFALIPRYGAAGSALATVLSQACSSFLFNLAHPRTRPVFLMQWRAALLLPLVRLRTPAASPGNRRPLPG